MANPRASTSRTPSEDIPTCFWCGQEFKTVQALTFHESEAHPRYESWDDPRDDPDWRPGVDGEPSGLDEGSR